MPERSTRDEFDIDAARAAAFGLTGRGYSAGPVLSAACDEIARLVREVADRDATLRFYADERNYHGRAHGVEWVSPIENDGGARARAWLASLDTESPSDV